MNELKLSPAVSADFSNLIPVWMIQGWDQILKLMRPGDKWVVIIPPELAYGSKGMRPLIPRDATLVFMIELLAANPE